MKVFFKDVPIGNTTGSKLDISRDFYIEIEHIK